MAFTSLVGIGAGLGAAGAGAGVGSAAGAGLTAALGSTGALLADAVLLAAVPSIIQATNRPDLPDAPGASTPNVARAELESARRRRQNRTVFAGPQGRAPTLSVPTLLGPSGRPRQGPTLGA